MFGNKRKRRDRRRGPIQTARRGLQFESLENRLMMTRSGVVEFDFLAPYDRTTAQGVRIVGDVQFNAEFTFLNSSDLSQISLGVNSIAGTGVVSEFFNGAPISGDVDVSVNNVDYNLAVDAAGVISMDATATGDFLAVVTLPAPAPPVNSTGDFTANFLGTVNLTTSAVVGTLELDILTDDGEIDENFSIPIDTTTTLIPGGFTLPDPNKASVSGVLWLDTDEDGQRDEAEDANLRRTGAVVELRDANTNALVGTSIANRFGGYSLIDVEAGDYTLQFTNLPKGNDFTTPNTGPEATDSDVTNNDSTPTFTLTVGQNDLNVDAGIVAGSAFQNLINRRDVNDQNGFTLADVFAVIQFFRDNGTESFGPVPETRQPDDLYIDINGDAKFDLVDIFDAIEGWRLTLQASEQVFGEGEAAILASRVDDDLVDTLARP